MGFSVETLDTRTLYLKELDSSVYWAPVAKHGKEYLIGNRPDIIKSITENNVKDNARIIRALKILDQGIATERANEKAYFSNFLSGSNLPANSKKLFQNAIMKHFKNDGNVDYMAIIDTINKILTGAESFKQIIELERKRLDELEKATKNLFDQINNGEFIVRHKSSDDAKPGRIKTADEIKKDMEKIYFERHTYNNSIYSSFFDKVTPTVDYLLAQVIRDSIYQIMNSPKTLKEIEENFKNDNLQGGNINDYIVATATKNIKEYIPQIIEQAINKNNPDDVADTISKQLSEEMRNKVEAYTVNGQVSMIKQAPNMIMRNKQGKLQAIGDAATKKLQDIVSALGEEAEDNTIIKQILDTEVNYQKLKKSGSSLKIRDALEYIKSEEQRIKDIQKDLESGQHGAKKSKVQNAEAVAATSKIIQDSKVSLSRLKEMTSKTIANFLKHELNKDLEKQTEQDLQQFLSRNIITLNGPNLSEFLDAIISDTKNVESFWSGKKNLKADTINITVEPVKIKLEFDLKDAPKKLNSQLKNTMQGASKTFYDTFYANLPKAGQSTNYQQGKEAWHKAMDATKEQIIKSNKFLSDMEDKEKAIAIATKMLSNTIVATNTMKTFNNYNNDIGFLSGSLGADIAMQVQNFATLFENAGASLSASEIEWLEVAIVNCSDMALGNVNKDPIEKFLSLMAGFAIFDEGAAEIESLVQIADNQISSSPKILHLYKLNGLYFPGSYILAKMRDNLGNIVESSNDFINNNDGAKINAYGSARDIPLALKGADLQEERWATTYKNAAENTRITVAFISGLLNIVNQLSQ